MKTFDEFKAFLEESLKDDLDSLETRRKNMRHWRGRLGGILLGVTTLSWALAYLYSSVSIYIIIVAVVITAPVVFFVYKKYFLDETIPENFKDLIVKNLVTFVDPSLNYYPEQHVSFDDFEASKLFMLRPDHYIGDDLIKGEMDGVSLQFSELHASFESNEKVQSTVFKKKKLIWKSIFDGLFLVADSPLEFNGRVFILDNNTYKTLGYLGTLIQKHHFYYGQYILPTNHDFRDKFAVYADDKLEGEKLLSKEFMQKILRLKSKSKSRVFISVIDNKLYMAVNMKKEIFKVNLNRSLSRAEHIKSFYNDLYYMLTIIDELNADEFMEAPATMGEDED
ncbi:DUF3137 domain-containing protein [Chondrinema litorale]|uniref:DUF3137 domain-containing protein n=1 Tax=Chondrinema litorale TaxID=2994555 RepID=UPI002543AC0F|nr:DUF3137 domain-containing protein [Chondrinema litorale]UZR93363.1 DUF3137 domain-containing protein [Chondrinema litorale]